MHINRYYITLLFLILFSATGKTQTKSAYGLFTDRDVYVSGEPLLAKIYLPEEVPSRIVCLDLVNQYGTRITGASLAIHNKEAEGYLQLPDSLSTGTYLVRIYQKYNAGKLKTIHEIFVTNRFDKPEKLDKIKIATSLSILKDQQTDLIQITGLQPSYSIKSKIEAGVQLDDSILKKVEGRLLVSVAQVYPTYVPITFSDQGEQKKEEMIEKRGVIITGIVSDRKTSMPAGGITVYLTIPDSIPGFQYYITRKDGRFYFLLDKYTGATQSVLQCLGNSPGQLLDFKLDEGFAESGKLPEFQLQSFPLDFKEALTRNISTVTFQKVFSQNYLKLVTTPQKSIKGHPYYGKASQSVDPRLFLDFANFSEISKELLRGVKFKNSNNELSLRVFNSSANEYFDESPLTLIDGIPIRDLKIIANLGTADIERIDVCQSERIFGNLRFPGVVAIYTTKKDISRIAESSQIVRKNLNGIQQSYLWAEPRITIATVPDLRQLLYWDSSAVPAKSISVQCNTSSVLGHYKLIVRGRLKDGTLIFSEKYFEVK
ncbi:MAG: hypothetical protein GZ094_07640 [Mariniphaga sp.]|nr:hypothetical protein [Mariniphaga sp.]